MTMEPDALEVWRAIIQDRNSLATWAEGIKAMRLDDVFALIRRLDQHLQQVEPDVHDDNGPNTNNVNLTEIGQHVTALSGIPAFVEMTGGGCATLYVGMGLGPPLAGDVAYGWGPRALCLVGPGWFEPHWTQRGAQGYVSLADCWIGPDDDGNENGFNPKQTTEIGIAAEIVTWLRERYPDVVGQPKDRDA